MQQKWKKEIVWKNYWLDFAHQKMNQNEPEKWRNNIKKKTKSKTHKQIVSSESVKI